jgi:Flp pilus assembly protein TadG
MEMVRPPRTALLKKRRGASTVEMAFAAPLLILMVFGIMEIAHAFMVQHLMQDAARQGCRAGLLPYATNSSVTSTSNQLLMSEGITTATINILVNGSAGDVAQANSGDAVTVNITVPSSDISIVPGLGYLTGQTHASVTLRRE